MGQRFCCYYRVSTIRQGESGLGLEAQRRAVEDYIAANAGAVVGEFQEIEGGAKNDRVQLQEAIRLCKMTGAKLLIAKLDRLSRDAHFLLGLEKLGVDFVCADMPAANRMTVGVMALVAEQERSAISARTKAALASIRARIDAGEVYTSKRSGQRVTRLGGPNNLPAASGSALGVAAVQAKANAHAERVAPMARALMAQLGTLQKVADSLNATGVKTPRNGAWTATAVRRALARTAPGVAA